MPILDPDRRRAYDRARKKKAREAAKAKGALPRQPGLAVDPPDPALAVAEWARRDLAIPDGHDLAGRPFALYGFQREFLTDALTAGVREAALCIGRKNAKTALIAVLLAAYLAGPLARPSWRGCVVSLNGKLAGELRDMVIEIGKTADPPLPIRYRRTPAPGVLEGVNGAKVDILAADKDTVGHAYGFDVVVIDEAGLLPERKRKMWNALYSSTSARDGRVLYISVLGDSPMFRELRDRREDREVVWHEYAAAATARIDDEAAWRAANPGLGSIKSISYMRDASRKAAASPADQADFRCFDMNCPGGASNATIVALDDWLGCLTDDPPARCGELVLGIDIGGASSMTAAVGIWPANGRVEAWAAFAADPGLEDRGEADGVGNLYADMAKRGELKTLPGRTTPAATFLGEVAADLDGERILAAGADRYRKSEVLDTMDEAGLAWPLEWSIERRRHAVDVRAFQRGVRGRRFRLASNLVLESAIRESVVGFDVAGNPTLAKDRTRGRIDAMSAAVIAAGLAEQWRKRLNDDWSVL